MTWILALTLATALPATPPPAPGFMAGADLARLCDPLSPDAEAGGLLCLGYVVGSVDQLLSQQSRRPESRRSVCLPKEISAERLRDVVVDHLARRPSRSAEAAGALIRQAMNIAFPCPPLRPGVIPR